MKIKLELEVDTESQHDTEILERIILLVEEIREHIEDQECE